MLKKIFIIVVILLAILAIVFQITEIFAINNNYSDYEKVYQINQDSNHFQFKSKTNFIIWKSCQILLLAITITLAFLNLKIKKGLIKYSFYFVVSLYLIWIARYYILWYLSGFDHYSGFDPYLF